jgi:hypothetical protein
LIATDLHGHSLFSDGRATPEFYVEHRAARRFEVIALSDHDTFAGVTRAKVVAKARALTLVPAMEATSFIHFGSERAEQVHILAYFPPSFLDDGRLFRTQLHARALKVHEAWRSYALDFVARQPVDVRAQLDEDALRATSASEFPQLQSFINRIAERSPDTFAHFQLDHVHFWDHADLFAWSPHDLIDAIRADGGFDVVAHPNRYRDKDALANVVEYANGIEVYTSRHNATVAAHFRALAESKRKHWTASSDDHQHRAYFHPPSGTPRATVERILRGA